MGHPVPKLPCSIDSKPYGNIPAVADILASATEFGRGNGFHEWRGYKLHEINGEEKSASQDYWEGYNHVLA